MGNDECQAGCNFNLLSDRILCKLEQWDHVKDWNSEEITYHPFLPDWGISISPRIYACVHSSLRLIPEFSKLDSPTREF